MASRSPSSLREYGSPAAPYHPIPSPHHPRKKNVAGCELCGVRACCMLTWRAGMLPIVFLTMRMPITAGETPTVPMLNTLSTMIFQIS